MCVAGTEHGSICQRCACCILAHPLCAQPDTVHARRHACARAGWHKTRLARAGGRRRGSSTAAVAKSPLTSLELSTPHDASTLPDASCVTGAAVSPTSSWIFAHSACVREQSFSQDSEIIPDQTNTTQHNTAQHRLCTQHSTDYAKSPDELPARKQSMCCHVTGSEAAVSAVRRDDAGRSTHL